MGPVFKAINPLMNGRPGSNMTKEIEEQKNLQQVSGLTFSSQSQSSVSHTHSHECIKFNRLYFTTELRAPPVVTFTD